jgi:16S rRNA (adenine1518-N6/adenine1519-N6)-dimethyltransferase
MKPILEQKFPFAKIVWGDFLKLDDHDLPENKEKILVCGNLPYYCATPIIRKFLVHGPKAERLVFLLQREVALKAAARSGSKDYGFLSLQIQFFAKAITGSTFGPESFSPPPKVKSTILELKPLPMNYQEKQKRLEILNQISVIFSQRRKIVLSLLKKRFPQTDWEDRFSLLKLDRKARPENLSLKQLYQLFSWI